MAGKWQKPGFTLVEMIVVLVILAVLAAAAIPVMTGYIGKAQETVCASQRAGLLRQLQADELAQKQGDGVFSASELAALAAAAQWHCPQGGTYRAVRHSGSIQVNCRVHGNTYGSNFAGGVDDMLNGSGYAPDVQATIDRIKNGTLTVDSTCTDPIHLNNVTAALETLGFDLSDSDMQSWSIQAQGVLGGKGAYYLYWSSVDISACALGQKVKVMRYNSRYGTYTAGYITITSATLNSGTYNVFSRTESDWAEYTGQQQTGSTKKDFNYTYSVYDQMPDTPV